MRAGSEIRSRPEDGKGAPFQLHHEVGFWLLPGMGNIERLRADQWSQRLPAHNLLRPAKSVANRGRGFPLPTATLFA